MIERKMYWTDSYEISKITFHHYSLYLKVTNLSLFMSKTFVLIGNTVFFLL